MNGIVQRYSLQRDLAPGSVSQLHYAIKSFGRFLGREPQAEDFTDDNVNRFIAWLPSLGYARDTIRTRRRSLLTLWRSLAEDELAATPRRVRPASPIHSLPQAWTPAQVAAVLERCDQLEGRFHSCRSVERRLFARAFCLTAYETGFRRGDLLRLRRPMIQPSGLIALVQSKTGRVHLARVRPETIETIDRMGCAGRELVFGGVISVRRLSRLFDTILAGAGIAEGSIKWLRRSGATHVEIDQPGRAWKYLGHTTPRIAHASYIDPLQTGQSPAIPPVPRASTGPEGA